MSDWQAWWYCAEIDGYEAAVYRVGNIWHWKVGKTLKNLEFDKGVATDPDIAYKAVESQVASNKVAEAEKEKLGTAAVQG
jgi:hypothetical protein